MSRSGIYAVNTTAGSNLAIGAVYAPSSIIRRYGQCCQMAGNGIVIEGAGYFDVEATVTVAASAAGTITATLYQDGNPVSGATATASVGAAADVVTLPLSALLRLNCNCSDSVITVVITGQAVTTNNLAIKVEKE